MSVYTKLNDAREKFHKLELKKTGHNKFANYFYFELGDFIIDALAVFRECGLCAYISFGTDLATMKIVDVESPGGNPETITITSPMSSAALKGCHDVQNLGAVQTYLRRYLWVAALEIVEHDALDATTGKKGDGPVIPARPVIDLDAETESFLQELASACIGLVKSGQAKQAWQSIQAAGLDDDQTIALANMMDSTTRSAIKKAKAE